MRALIVRTLSVLLVSAASANAQASDTTTVRRGDSLAPVRIQDFAATLGVAVPQGELVRSKTETPELLRRLTAARERLQAFRTSGPTSGSTPSCPMPIVRADSATLSPMPVVAPDGEFPPAGRLRGCENPLR